MTSPVGTITVKLVLDTSELDAKLAELNKNAMRAPVKSPSRIDRIETAFRGATFSPEDAHKIIAMVRSRTRG